MGGDGEHGAATGKGVAGALVSDGRQVVRTAADGSYELVGVTPGVQRFVWVVVPTGYRLGDSFYQAVAPDAADFSHDFVLTPDPASNRRIFSFGHLTDPHGAGAARASAFWSGLTPERVAFVVLTGDVVNDAADTASFHTMRETLRGAAVPILPLPGNHDLFVRGSGALVVRTPLALQPPAAPGEDPPGVAEERVYEDFFGPAYYAFEYGGRCFLMLNSSAELAQQREWVGNLITALPAERELVVCQHYPPEREETLFWARHSVCAFFHGHTHADLVQTHDDILYVNTAGVRNSRDHSPLTFRVATFGGDNRLTLDNYSVDHRDQRDLPPLPVPAMPAPRIVLGGDVPQFKADAARSGHNDGAARAPWSVAWVHPLGGMVFNGSPVLTGGILAIGIGDRDNRKPSAVYALDPLTGAVKWSRETGPAPLLAADGERLFMTTADGAVTALNAATGEPLWRFVLGKFPTYRLYTPPAIVGGEVFAGNGKHFAALVATSGEQSWRMPDLGAGMWATFAAAAVAEGGVFLTVPGRGVYRYDAETGAQNWFADKVVVGTINPSTPLVHAGHLYVNTQGSLLALSLVTGETVWQVKSPGRTSSPVSDGDGVILAGAANVVKFNAADGKVVWTAVGVTGRKKGEPQRFYFQDSVMAAPVVTCDQVHIPTTEGVLLSLNVADGSEAGRLDLARPFAGSAPAASGNALFLAAYDGTIFGLVGEQ